MKSLCCWLAGATLLMGVVRGAVAGERVNYLKEIKPLLSERCYSCHGVLKQKAKLRLETRELWTKGGESGAVILAGDPGRSLLMERITAVDEERMPPQEDGTRLSSAEVALIRAWIEQGAEAPDEPVPGAPDQHWAFQKPTRGELPVVKGDWGDHPIDAFLAGGHAARGLVPVPLANRRVLLRRVYLDLIGLPPTREELRAFEEDSSSDAYDRVVRDLLGRPSHGERWGRHWMDVWRYADWFGLGAQLRNSQKHLWHWRDWIIESLNADKGYDRMIREMLSADEMAPNDADAMRATGFLARHYYLFNRDTWLEDTVEHTSKAFLGLTLNCARCHDHKYDPISQVDYYSMRAFFEPYQVRLDAVPGETDLEKDGLPRVFDAHPEAPTYLYVRGDTKNPDKERVIRPGLPSVLGAGSIEPVAVELPPEAWEPGLREYVLADRLREAERQIEQARVELKKARTGLVSRETAELSEGDSGEEGAVFIEDEFDGARPEIWEAGSGEREYRDGKMRQSQLGPSRAYIRSVKNHPRDFEARYSFVTLGGDKWRSVGLNFDVADGREKMIYMSAVEPGSKLQISYKNEGGEAYPAEGRQGREVKLGQRYEVRIAVRDRLVNVDVDGRPSLAYELPVEREAGRLDLIAFDAVAEFESIVVRGLPAGAVMVPAGAEGGGLTLVEAKLGVVLAERVLAAAELRPAALRAAQAADRAKAMGKDDAAGLVVVAAKAARALELGEAEVAVLRAERKLERREDETEARKELKVARKALVKARERLEKPGDRYTSLRGSLKALEGPDEKEDSRRKPYPKASTGRRTALAEWIGSRENPLTARVMVNHIWMRHFGQPLVESVTDFGLRAPVPVQQALLDWLAVELMENGWSMKHLHHLIVTSRAYRLSSSTLGADERTMKLDSGNQYYWRRLPVRMESQVIRDSLLSMAGVLDEAMGGAPVAVSNEASNRRSLYYVHSRDGRDKFLSMFDDADILRCYRRSESVVPQQALALANSRQALTLARKLSERLGRELGEVEEEVFVRAAFETVLGVLPSDEELRICRESMEATREVLGVGEKKDVEGRVRANLVHALVNHNDFVTVR